MIKNVVKVQRAYRVRKTVYKHFGPNLFMTSRGTPASGRIAFTTDSSVRVPWISISNKTSPARLAIFVREYWCLPEPKLLITVTGGLEDIKLSPTLQQAFDLGLATAATSAKAWIFTRGSDTGVMKLVGNTIVRHGLTVPLIGVLPWGCINGRDELHRNIGRITSYSNEVAGQPSAYSSPLNRHHSHFVFVDNGKAGKDAWGSEIDMRATLELAVCKAQKTPVVQLVVQCTPDDIATVLNSSMAGQPIVIVAESGGAAGAIKDFRFGGLQAV